MPALTDKFTNASSGSRPSPTTLNAIKTVGASSISCAALTGWPTTTAVHFIIYNVTTAGTKLAGSQTDWKGIVSGTTITNLTLKAGTDNGYSIGAVVEAGPTAAWADDLASGLTTEHTLTGLHNSAAATTIAALLPAASVAPTALAGSIPYAKLLSTIFSSQVTSFTNTGSGAGTFYSVNLGGIKLVWGVTGNLATSTAATTFSLVHPVSFFTTVQFASATAINMVTTANQYANISGTTATSTSGYIISNTTGTAGISFLVIGT